MVSPNKIKKRHNLTDYKRAPIYIKLREARLINNKKLFKIMKEEGISFDI